MSNIFSGDKPHGQTPEHKANDRATLRDELGMTKPGDLASHHERLEELNQELQSVAHGTSMDDLDQTSEWVREAMRNTSEAIDALVESQTPDGVDGEDALQTWHKQVNNGETGLQYHDQKFEGFYLWLERGSDDYIHDMVNKGNALVDKP